MVDTVMSRADWERVFGVARGRLAGGADAILTITPGEQDESPLVVRFGRGGRITELVDQPAASGDWVTGGVYGSSARPPARSPPVPGRRGPSNARLSAPPSRGRPAGRVG
jgi:hypothetical protein